MAGEGLEQAEYRLLCQAVQEACSLHARGDSWAGYRCLADGLERVRSFAGEGDNWAAELARSYLLALEEYAQVVGRPTVIYQGETTTTGPKPQ